MWWLCIFLNNYLFSHLTSTKLSVHSKLWLRCEGRWWWFRLFLPFNQRPPFHLPQSTGSVGKGLLIPNFAIIGNCRLGNGQGRHSLEGGEIHTQTHHLPRHLLHGSIRPNKLTFLVLVSISLKKWHCGAIFVKKNCWLNRDILTPANMHLMVCDQYKFHLSIACDM